MTYTLIGAEGSPYSIKVRAALRWRRIPHVWRRLDAAASREIAHLRPPVIPVLRYPDGSYGVDSTPMLLELETREAARGRLLVPEDPALAFVARLIEDFADEWGTKPMFHWRWDAPIDQTIVSQWLMWDRDPWASEGTLAAQAAMFRARQTGRVAMVGGGDANRALVEASGLRIWEAMEGHLRGSGPYLLGTRPSLADFAWWGQLKQMASDPTPGAMMRHKAPTLYRWTRWMDDLSGEEEGAWSSVAGADVEAWSPGVRGLLDVVGSVYLPFLEANARAHAAGEPTFTYEAWGCSYSQGTFKYQVKCLGILRELWRALDGSSQKTLTPLLDQTGCLSALAGE